MRVTFDRELCYKVTDEPQVRLGGSGWRRHTFTTGHTILEIKFTGCYPMWLTPPGERVRSGGDSDIQVRHLGDTGMPAWFLWTGLEGFLVWIGCGN